MSDISCTVCGTELDLATLFAHADDQRALARLVALSVPIGNRVLQYVTLFKPEKQNLTAAKKIKLIAQLLPDLERKAVTYKGRDWTAPLSAWGDAIDSMLASRNAGRLELPLKGHNYLYSTLARMADGIEAAAEAKVEEDARLRPRRDTVQVRGQTMEIGTALDVVYGGKAPALAAVEERNRNAAPMPEHVRAKLAQIKKGDRPC